VSTASPGPPNDVTVSAQIGIIVRNKMPQAIRATTGPRRERAYPPAMPNIGTPIAPPPTPPSNIVAGSRSPGSRTPAKRSGARASHRQPRRPPVRRRYSAQPSSNPVTRPGARIQPNVPDQVTAESRGRSEPLRLGVRCDRTVRAGALLATLVSSAVELDPGKGPAQRSAGPGRERATLHDLPAPRMRA
jgi:hypothetical protein